MTSPLFILVTSFVHPLERIELEIVFLIEPAVSEQDRKAARERGFFVRESCVWGVVLA
jgi:hypothetical protein